MLEKYVTMLENETNKPTAQSVINSSIMNKNEAFEKFIDFPIPDEKVEELGRQLINDKWEVSKERWMEAESVQFYKGLYAGMRLMESLVLKGNLTDYKPEFISDVLSRFGLDCLYIIQKKIDQSKIDG
jgi:hypothetical protein